MDEDGFPLLGVMSRHRSGERCHCGHLAAEHNPCCGACSICGTVYCSEFSKAQP